jgi:hypothetical protein
MSFGTTLRRVSRKYGKIGHDNGMLSKVTRCPL